MYFEDLSVLFSPNIYILLIWLSERGTCILLKNTQQFQSFCVNKHAPGICGGVNPEVVWKTPFCRDLRHPDAWRQIVWQPMMKMPKLWAILSYFVLWCVVDVRAASDFNPEYFKRHLLWQMNPLCSFQTKAWKCGRVLSATSKKSSWTYADSTYSMYSMFF